ncbi:MAG: YwqG family protein [Pseudomonadota bacterium]
MANVIGLIVTLLVVGFFLYRQHKAERTQSSSPKRINPKPDPNDTTDWPAVVAKATDSAMAQEKPAVALDMTSAANTDAPHSCIGGRPSLPKDMGWPVDAHGKPMLFLAQINFQDMPALAGYPATGLLSVFVTDDDLNGCDFPSIDQKGFKTFYFGDTADLTRHDLPEVTWEFSPLSDKLLQEGRRVTGRAATGVPSPNSNTVAELTKDWYPNCPSDLWDELWDALSKAKPGILYYGGHPDFTQDDFRRAGSEPTYLQYTEVLLQMGFFYHRETGIEVCWGDAGEACFLMTKDDLSARRFNRSAYNWDCS